MNVHGLIVDPQEDFCSPDTGTLYVPGAEKDMTRLASLLGRVGDGVTGLHVTLDSHHYLDIAHPIWWRGRDGSPPAPFTIITGRDIDAGTWQAADPDARARSREYVAALERHGRYPLCIWPYHCLIGTPGHAVTPLLSAALAAWEGRQRTPVDYVWKGQNVWTEHYSAIQADVPDPSDPSTQPNEKLLARIAAADLVFVAGEAGSHCVANTLRDIVARCEGDRARIQKLVLLTDAISPVPGFEALQEAFLAEMAAKGVRFATTDSIPALLN